MDYCHDIALSMFVTLICCLQCGHGTPTHRLKDMEADRALLDKINHSHISYFVSNVDVTIPLQHSSKCSDTNGTFPLDGCR